MSLLRCAVLLLAMSALTFSNIQSAADDLDGLWKFLQQNFGLVAPDFTPMPMPEEGKQLLKDGYSHEERLFHHSFIKRGAVSGSGEVPEDHVVITYPSDRLLNWRVLRDALRIGYEQLERLRSDSIAESDSLAPLKEKTMGYWDFIPRELASIPVNGSLVTFASPCYRQYTARFVEIDAGGGTLHVTVNQTDPYRTDCVGIDEELLSFSSALGYPKVHTVEAAKPGDDGITSFTLQLISWAKDEYAYLERSGMHVSVWPLGVLGTVLSVINTTELFVSSSDYTLAKNNAAFMTDRVNFTMVKRQESVVDIVPDEQDVRNGDIFHILRLDGLDPLVGWGTGGRTGHTTMVMNISGATHVVESTAANPFGKVYWPPPYGVISTPYAQWFKQAKKAEYHMVWSRLNDDLASKFVGNLEKAQEFFEAVKGQPYGFHNFIYSFFDTTAHNLPFPITPYLFHGATNLVDRLSDNHTSQMSVYSLLTQGFNHRLNTSCQDMECVNEVLLQKNMMFAEAVAMPELDSYRYEGQHSMVCDVFIISVFKAAGIVLDSIQATEQTPKDLYQMDIYNKTTDWLPDVCKKAPDFDPKTPSCQLMGDYALPLNNFSTIALYPKMNERCYSNPYDSYWRGPDAKTC